MANKHPPDSVIRCDCPPHPSPEASQKKKPTDPTYKPRRPGCAIPAVADPDSAIHKPTVPLNALGTPIIPAAFPDLQGTNNPRAITARSARLWYIYGERPPHVTQMAWNSLDQKTRNKHISLLRTIKTMPADLERGPLVTACVELIRRMAIAGKWVWSTISGKLSTLKGALIGLPMYTRELKGIDLSHDPEFRSAQKYAHRMERLESGEVGARPMTIDQYRDCMKRLANDPSTRLYLNMMWSSLQSPEAVVQIRPEDIFWKTAGKGSEEKIAVTCRRGKHGIRSGPFPMLINLDSTSANTLRQMIGKGRKGLSIFVSTNVREKLKEILKKIGLTLPSTRKGAARLLADTMTIEQLRIVLNHKDRKTTTLYLGYAATLGLDQRQTLDGMRSLLANPPSPAEHGQEMIGDNARDLMQSGR